MTPQHRYMVAFLAASLTARRVFTHVYDHDAQREIPVGGMVRPDRIDVVERDGVRFSGTPEALLDHQTQGQIQLQLEDGGFSGFDYASGRHFKGVFSGPLPDAAVQLFDHETGRYHDFHVS
jgi:hypothetical protein